MLFFVYLLLHQLTTYLKEQITYLFLLLLTTICSANTTIPDTLRITSKYTTHRAGKFLSTLEDPSNNLELTDVLTNNSFITSDSEIPNFEITKSTYWAKLIVKNTTPFTDDFILKFEKITADKLSFYYKIEGSSEFKKIKIKKGKKKYDHRLFLVDISIPKQKSAVIYIQFKTNWGTTFPVVFGAKEKVFQEDFDEELFKGIYIGIMFIMVFYNIFIYFSIKDKSYLYYVFYIFLFLYLQLNDLGYTYKYLFYNHPIGYDLGIKIIPSLTGIAVILFIRSFLKTNKNIPILDKGLNYIIVIFILLLGFAFNNQNNGLFFTLLNLLTLSFALYLLAIGIVLSIKKVFLAKYFLLAWSIFLVSIILVNLSNLDLLPYFEITDHSLEIGSVIEIFLLSLALAQRINALRKESESSQNRALKLAEEKKNIIENQNQVLEKLVQNRTSELEFQNKIISAKNEEKSIMMREIHHRVKNNLQMINSMVRLQTRYHHKDNTIDSLKEIENRILTMALLHEKMYQSENLVSINIKDYITEVLIDLLKIDKSEKNINHTIKAPEINLKNETVLYIGLLINELITNSLKHSFNNREDGWLYIDLVQKEENNYVINVSNNGEKIDIEKYNSSNTMGHRLINNFIKQLNGNLNIKCNEDITTFSIEFKEV